MNKDALKMVIYEDMVDMYCHMYESINNNYDILFEQYFERESGIANKKEINNSIPILDCEKENVILKMLDMSNNYFMEASIMKNNFINREIESIKITEIVGKYDQKMLMIKVEQLMDDFGGMLMVSVSNSISAEGEPLKFNDKQPDLMWTMDYNSFKSVLHGVKESYDNTSNMYLN